MTTKTTQITNDFENYLNQLGYSQASQIMLPRLLTEFLHNTNKPLENIEPIDILNYYEYIKNRPRKRGGGTLSESSINHHIYTLRVFFNYQMEIGGITINPISMLSFPRPKTKPREILTQKEIKKVFEECVTYRERTVLCLCYGLGLRRSEAIKIDIEDIHFKTSLAYIREGKGKKRRVIPMNPTVSKYLKMYLESERTSTKTKAFITTKTGNRTAGENLNMTLKNVLKRTEITKTISLHCLRHSIATHLLQNGLSIDYVRDFLGHKHLETTQIYTRVKNRQLWNLKSI
jgi:integrase/recombinase XerD